MDMQMRYRLPGPETDVDADIVSIGLVLLVGHFLAFGDKLPQFFAFLVSDIEVI